MGFKHEPYSLELDRGNGGTHYNIREFEYGICSNGGAIKRDVYDYNNIADSFIGGDPDRFV